MGNNMPMMSPKDMSTEEMRKLIERNEVINPLAGSGGGGGGQNLLPYDTVNV